MQCMKRWQETQAALIDILKFQMSSRLSIGCRTDLWSCQASDAMLHYFQFQIYFNLLQFASAQVQNYNRRQNQCNTHNRSSSQRLVEDNRAKHSLRHQFNRHKNAGFACIHFRQSERIECIREEGCDEPCAEYPPYYLAISLHYAADMIPVDHYYTAKRAEKETVESQR